MNLNADLIAYIISVSFQVAGALMLIIFAISTKRGNIIRAFASSNVIIEDGNTHELTYNEDQFVQTYRNAYYSKTSVAFIALGYAFGVFGNIGDSNKWVVLSIIVALTIMLILFIRFIIESVLKKKTKAITKEELETSGSHATIASISNDKIDRICQ